MDPLVERSRELTRRTLFTRATRGLGALALGSMLQRDLLARTGDDRGGIGLPELPHFRPKVKRVIYLFFSGGPSHIDLFDYKPSLHQIHGKELPESIRQGQRLTTMTSGQSSFPCVAPMFEFARHGQHGTWVSELLPHTAKIVDKITIIKSMFTEAINHDPAITFFNTGQQQPGRPSMGRVVELRPRQRQSRSARLHRDDLTRERQPAGAVRSALVGRLPASETPGGEVP